MPSYHQPSGPRWKGKAHIAQCPAACAPLQSQSLPELFHVGVSQAYSQQQKITYESKGLSCSAAPAFSP